MENEAKDFTSFFIIFREVMNLQSFQFDVSNVIPANIHNSSPFFCICFCQFNGERDL